MKHAGLALSSTLFIRATEPGESYRELSVNDALLVLMATIRLYPVHINVSLRDCGGLGSMTSQHAMADTSDSISQKKERRWWSGRW